MNLIVKILSFNSEKEIGLYIIEMAKYDYYPIGFMFNYQGRIAFPFLLHEKLYLA